MQDGSAHPLLGAPVDALDHEGRLVRAMAEALLTKPLSDVTVSEVVRLARVSKRTFYECFVDKEACFLATYAAVSSEVLRRIAEATRSATDPDDQLERATAAYFEALEREPRLTRVFLTDLSAAGAHALSARRAVHQRFAALLVTLVAQGAGQRAGVRPLTEAMATALVGAINELVLWKLESSSDARLSELNDTARTLLRAVLGLPEPARGRNTHPKRSP